MEDGYIMTLRFYKDSIDRGKCLASASLVSITSSESRKKQLQFFNFFIERD